VWGVYVNKLLTLPAVDTTIEAKASKGPPRVLIRAYGGGAMKVDGWGDVAIDLRGLKMPEQLTLLADHANELGSVVGTGRPQVKDNQLVVTGHLVGSAAGVHVADLLKAGVALGASVGVAPIQSSWIKAGSTVRVNGRSIEAPASGLTLVKSGELKEVSIVALAADADTRVALAAKRAATDTGNTGLDEDKIITATDDESVATDTETVDVAEATRRANIARLCGTAFPAIEAKAIAENWDTQRTELEILRAKRPTVRPGFSTTPQEYARPHDLLTAALLLRCGRGELATKELGERTTQQAHDLRAHSLVDVCSVAVRAAGMAPPRDRTGLIRAAFSSSDLSNALADVAGKVALQAYRDAPSVWRLFCRVIPARDFKAQRLLRVTLGREYELLPNGGEIKHGALNDQQSTVTAATYAQLLTLTRQDVINDDLSLFSQVAELMGRSGARAISDQVFRVLLANLDPDGNAFFSAGNANYLEGTETSLSSHSLPIALAALSSRRDSEGRNLDLRGRTLIVPPELEMSARELLSSSTVARYVADGTDKMPEGNVLQNVLQLGVEPRLSNDATLPNGADRFPGHSDKGWYVFSDVADGCVTVSFLDGVDRPTVESVELPMDVLGIGFRGYIDFGVALSDPAAGQFMLGENEA